MRPFSKRRRRFNGGGGRPFNLQPKGIAPRATTTMKGSALRGGNAIIGVGGQGVAIANGGKESDPYSIEEEAVLNRLVVPWSDSQVAITDVVLNNDSRITGTVPAAVFARDSLWSPSFGAYVSPQSKLRVEASNDTGGLLNLTTAFDSQSVPPGQYREGFNVYGRRPLLAIGGPGWLTIAFGGVPVETDWDIEESGVAARFIAQVVPDGVNPTTPEDAIYVESIRYDNVELLSGRIPITMFRRDCASNPLLGILFEESHSLKVVYSNQGTVNSAVIGAAFTVA